MKRKFITPVIMRCDRDQAVFLAEELEKLGHHKFIISVSCTNENRCISTKNRSYMFLPYAEELKDHGFIDGYNPDLFLALAAMTAGQKFWPGEWIFREPGDLSFKDKPFKVLGVDSEGLICYGEDHHDVGHPDDFRKATAEEIHEYFAKQLGFESESLSSVPMRAPEVGISASSLFRPMIDLFKSEGDCQKIFTYLFPEGTFDFVYLDDSSPGQSYVDISGYTPNLTDNSLPQKITYIYIDEQGHAVIEQGDRELRLPVSPFAFADFIRSLGYGPSTSALNNPERRLTKVETLQAELEEADVKALDSLFKSVVERTLMNMIRHSPRGKYSLLSTRRHE